ncbi:MAG: carbon-nitrogen hydrolase [Phycisphaerae bacterium]|nr:carbon-nitrogen hydrolase [Phycisphaerae bacterium]
MRFACIQHDIAWEDKPANQGHIQQMLAESNLERGSFCVLPELADTGFSINTERTCEGDSLGWATAMARSHSMWIQSGHVHGTPSGPVHNCASIVCPDGTVLGSYRKIFPFMTEAPHYESGARLLLARCNGVHVCPMICYDLRFPELWRLATLAGTEVFTIGASWPARRQSHWRSLLIARAIENQAFVVAANRVGHDPNTNYLGGSMIIDPRGEVIHEASDGEAVLQAELDLADLRRWRRKFPVLEDVRHHLLGNVQIESVDFDQLAISSTDH